MEWPKEQLAKSKEPRRQQLSLIECDNRTRCWDINDARSKRIHCRIGQMIATDCHPLSLVEDEGFICLLKELEPRYSLPSRRYFTDNVLTELFESLRDTVLQMITGVKYLSFTTDIWSTCVSNESLLSLTAHWITNTFECRAAMLNAARITGSHTGSCIAEKVSEILQSWGISSDRIHVILRDNGSNMIKAMKDGDFPNLGCFAHTLQLVVHDGVLAQQAVINLLAICRQIVGHFKHSPLAYSRLHEIQENLGLPLHKLKQDVPTRWNSSLHMLQSIIEQKMALAAYSTEHSITQLSSHQLDLANKAVAALSPVEEITKAISSDAASVSTIIPFIRMLERSLDKLHDDRGVHSMRQEMLRSLRRRYENVESNEILTISTILDPRFKDKCFTASSTVERSIYALKDKVMEIRSNQAPPTDTDKEPVSKRHKTGLLQCLSEILEEAGASVDDCGNEVELYLSEPLIEFHGGHHVLTWWSTNKVRFPHLAVLAQRYLSAPPTSVPSERLFSIAGDVYDEKRSRLSTDHAEALLFIKSNFHLTK